jgi:hypothetical protein
MSEDIFDEAQLREIITNQLADNNPTHVTATLLRLTMKGMDKEEAIDYLSCALAAELMAMEADQGPFNLTRYQSYLDSLPQMPWAEE